MGNINNATLPRFICLATTSLQATEHSAFRLFFSFPFIPTKPACFAELAHIHMVQRARLDMDSLGSIARALREHWVSAFATAFCFFDSTPNRTLAMGFSFDYYGKDDEWDRT
jgi:hypothetical protein